MSGLYVHATLKLRTGGYDKFCEILGQMKPMFEDFGWKLTGAWTTGVGRIYTVIHIWEIGDANNFFQVTGNLHGHAVVRVGM